MNSLAAHKSPDSPAEPSTELERTAAVECSEGLGVRCSCRDKKCRLRAWISDSGLWLQTNDGRDHMMYLDANAIVALIAALRRELMRQTNGEDT